MAEIIYSEQALLDLERLTDFLLESFPEDALATFALIEEAIVMLKNHPLIGRPVEHDLRELVISRGRTGYIALYHMDLITARIIILAVRHQREAGYFDGNA